MWIKELQPTKTPKKSIVVLMTHAIMQWNSLRAWREFELIKRQGRRLQLEL